MIVGTFGLHTPLLERVAADGERLLGAGHPDTLSYRNNLGTARPGEQVLVLATDPGQVA
jgi:hypothetical protein